jgi:hypothetical protein
MPIHKWKRLEAPWGKQVEIDRGIVKLIRLIWELDIQTLFSCENHEGWVHVAVPDVATAVRYWRAGNYAHFPARWQEESLLQALTLVQATAVRIQDEVGIMPSLTIRCWFDWQFYVPGKNLVYCEFPVDKLAKVESNLQLALPWGDSGTNGHSRPDAGARPASGTVPRDQAGEVNQS